MSFSERPPSGNSRTEIPCSRISLAPSASISATRARRRDHGQDAPLGADASPGKGSRTGLLWRRTGTRSGSALSTPGCPGSWHDWPPEHSSAHGSSFSTPVTSQRTKQTPAASATIRGQPVLRYASPIPNRARKRNGPHHGGQNMIAGAEMRTARNFHTLESAILLLLNHGSHLVE